MEQRQTADGTTVHVDPSDTRHGSEDSFYVVYVDAAGEERWGYQCGNCDSFDTAVDTMGRIVCNSCPNTRKPEEWDAAHE